MKYMLIYILQFYQIGTDLPLLNTTSDHVKQLAKALGGVTINAKGKNDIISDGEQGIMLISLHLNICACASIYSSQQQQV